MPRVNRQLFIKTLPFLFIFLAGFVICLYLYSGNQVQTGRRQGVGTLPKSVPGETVKPNQTAQAKQAQMVEAYGKLPLSFVANEGQADSQVNFYSRGKGYGLFLTPTEAVLALSKSAIKNPHKRAAHTNEKGTTESSVQTVGQTSVLRMKLKGANPQSEVKGLDELPGKVNHFAGTSPDKGHTDIATYAKVRYEEVYPGIDLIYYGNQRQFEYDFVVAPEVDPRIIKIAFQGMRALAIDEQGDLVLKAQDTEIRLRKPFSYQLMNGERREVASRYVIRKGNELGFIIDDYDKSKPLTIDPVLIYSTYLGGSNGNPTIDEAANSIAVDASGNAYVTGTTTSMDFPVANAYKPSGGGFSDAFVSKLNSSGSVLMYSTYLGGNRNDYGKGIAVDSAGAAYVTGTSDSTDFPVTPGAYQTTGLDTDVFITKLSPAGNTLVYSTLLSGDRSSAGPGLNLASSEYGYAIAVNAQGEACVTGETQSVNFPAANPAQASRSAGFDLFVTKLNADGTGLVFSTYWGGNNTDYGRGVALDSLGNVYVTGITYSNNFPTTSGAFKTTLGTGDIDAFVAKFSPNGSPVYSTYVGGDSFDTANGIAVDSNGNAFITGDTISNNFPTTGTALKKTFSKGAVFKSTDGSAKWRATGLTDQFTVNAVAVDPVNSMTIYAGSDGGIFKSTDGGSSWTAMGLANIIVRSIAIDPTNPSKIFAGTFGQGIFKSTDGSNSWTNPVTSGNVNALVFDPRGSDRVYAGTGSGTLISTDGGSNWSTFRAGGNIKAIVFDPITPSTIYLCANNGIIKSVDNGANWNFLLQVSGFTSLVIDPKNPSILYAANQSFGVYKFTDGGLSWTTVNNGLASHQAYSLAIDPVSPATVYVGLADYGVYKTTNSGSNWAVTGLAYSTVTALTIDPTNPSVLYAASSAYQTDAFVTELNAAGSALVYSTYLGGTGYDKAFGIAIDSQGNTYLTGVTGSIDFPLVQPLQQMNGIATEAFIIKLNSANASVAFSTYLGGRLSDQANGIAVDADGNIYVAGITRSDDFPIASPLQSSLNSIFDTFVTKISATSTPATVQLSAPNYTVSEAGGSAQLVVTRTDTASAATVNYATSDTFTISQNCQTINTGIASSRCDYATSIGTLRFAAGESSKTIYIPVIDDNISDGNESFTLTLSNPSGASLGSTTSATVTITDNANTGGNPIDQAAFFIREHYIDFLGREPEPAGLSGWLNVYNNCGTTVQQPCDRIEISSAFFRSEEFQTRAYPLYRFYSAVGRIPLYEQFMPDFAKVSGFLSAQELEANKVAFINEFMARSDYQNLYGSITGNEAYVTALLNTLGLPTHANKQAWVNALNSGTSRAVVLRSVTEDGQVYQKYYNEAFVIMQYFGYLRRSADISYLSWIQTMNTNGGDYRQMINGFLNSAEYRNRFGQ